jgi:pyrroline-5-carboxylate reductase
MESLTEASIALGFSPQAANELVKQTALGSTGYAASAGLELAELRRRVTSPGGTTAEAIKVFESGQLKQIIIDAACQAHKRAKEMGES